MWERKFNIGIHCLQCKEREHTTINLIEGYYDEPSVLDIVCNKCGSVVTVWDGQITPGIILEKIKKKN